MSDVVSAGETRGGGTHRCRAFRAKGEYEVRVVQ